MRILWQAIKVPRIVRKVILIAHGYTNNKVRTISAPFILGNDIKKGCPETPLLL